MVYAAEAGNIDIALTGDSLITRRMSIFQEPEFLELVKILRAADATVTNVEMLFHDYGSAPTVVPGGTYMAAKPELIKDLEWLGINLVSGANNHVYDFGENGLVTHIRHLREANMVFAGIGMNMGDAREPRYLDTVNGRVAIISVTSSGPPGLYAGHQWRDGLGRPGANMIRHTTRYVVDSPTFDAVRKMRDELDLVGRLRNRGGGYLNHSWGMADIPDTDDEFMMGDLHTPWQYPLPNGYRFVRGDHFARELVPDRSDLEENIQRISDARRMADWVIVSMHNHEQGLTPDDPSDIAVTFAHAAIDAGADVFHGHGPHRDRGIEVYKGKPIFYSIGQFIFQNETVERVPLENHRRQGLSSWESVPADFYDSRSGRERAGEWYSHGSRPAAWRDVVAQVQFRGGELAGIKLRPIDLGYRRSRAQRGRPVLAHGDTATEALQLFQRLSGPYGTKIEVQDGVGVVRW